jgi:hypothetical protein
VIGLGRAAAPTPRTTCCSFRLLTFTRPRLSDTTTCLFPRHTERCRHHSHIHKLLHHHRHVSCHRFPALPCLASPTWHHAHATVIHKFLCHHHHASSHHLSALLCLAAPPWHCARATVITSFYASFPLSPSSKTSQPSTTPLTGSGGSSTASSESSLVTSSFNGPPANLTSQPLLRVLEPELQPWSLPLSGRGCHAPTVARSELEL